MTDGADGTHLVLVLSDLHFGKYQASDGRLEAYDLEIADERVRGIPAQLRGLDTPASLTVLLVGDLVDGSGIYPHQDTVTDDPNPLKQVAMCIGALWHTLSKIAKMWPGVPIHVRSVRGNHGRLHPSAHPQANWDNQVVYRLAELAMPVQQLDVVPHYGLSYVMPVGSIRLAMIHRAEKHGSTPALMARVMRRLKHYKADLLICGHWHTPGYYECDGDPLLLTNGCLCGPDEYSEQIGAFGRPSQALLEVVGDRLTVDWLRW